MKFAKPIAALVFCLTIVSCKAGLIPDPNKKFTGGQEPEQYYSQYIYKPETSTGHYSYLATDGFKLFDMGGNRYVSATVTVFLLKNKNFTLIYEENLTCSQSTGAYNIRTYKLPLQGIWRVEGTKVILGSVGELTTSSKTTNTGNGRSSLQIKIYKDIHAQYLSSKTNSLTFTTTLQSMENMIEDNTFKSLDEATRTMNMYCTH